MTCQTLAVLVGTLTGIAAALNPPPPADQSAPATHDDIAGKPSLVAEDASADLKRTLVVPDFEHELTPGRSVLWCSTIQLAWNELAGLMGGPLKGVGPAAPMIEALNTSAATRADLDDASYIAMAGFGRDDILEKVRAALDSRFKGSASPKLIPPRIDSDTIFSYSYLFKNLAFKDPFIRREHPLPFGADGKGQVASFGLWDDQRIRNWSTLAGQVSILSYSSPTEWVVELRTTSAGDRLLIARLAPKPTLSATVDAVHAAAAAAKPQKMDKRDILIVPIINFDITRRYRELEDGPIQGTKEQAVISSAMQNIRLRLDERGAVLKSEAAIVAATSALIQDKPREMICDGPFLIMMQRADSPRPYLAMWVENPEVLVGYGN